jgi:ABC-type hemin transport system ATPase subunit
VLWHARQQREWPELDAAGLRAFMPQQTVGRFPTTVARLIELSIVSPRHDTRRTRRTRRT